MGASMMDAINIFRFLARKSTAGRTAIVTVTQVTGSSMRNPGTHLAVAQDGEWCGSLSGGCVEAAIVAEARDALVAGQPREVRFGAGSPYIDVRLPCGGSLDVLVTPIEDPGLGQRALDYFERRTPFVLCLPLEACNVSIEPDEPNWRTRRDADAFRVSHLPELAIVVVGHGASVEALNQQAKAFGVSTRVFTPDQAIVDRLRSDESPAILLRLPSKKLAFGADRWTAIAFVFHDHDWEAQLLIGALESPAFYVGAMGGKIANARRVEMLEQSEVAAADILRLRAPIGLIPSSRDPQVLALSALSEIVRDFGRLTDRLDVQQPH
jgi:xanthine dehydrogenase accessory factor